MKELAQKLANTILQAHIGVSLHPYPPERIDIPKSEFDMICKIAEQILKEVSDEHPKTV